MLEAVTGALVQGGEILVVRRQPYLPVFPGFLAFPGGKIDQADVAGNFSHPLVDPFPTSHVQALCRELAEELGFDLKQALAQGEVSSLALMGTSITPIFDRYRFRVHHFKIMLKRRPVIEADHNEIAWHGWASGKALIERFERGQELMVIPTRNILKTLARDINSELVTPLGLSYVEDRELPFIELIKGIGIIPVPSMTLPPARYTNAVLIGDPGSPLCLVDPSPESEDVYRKLLETLSTYPPAMLLITHHHPDHHQYAPRLARQLNLPLLCTETTARRLEATYGHQYLESVTVRPIGEGTVITRWLGEPVRCIELPGHDDGMVGLAPDSLSWFLISDLIQTMGSVVIPEPEGDMQAYLDTLQRVIAMQPRVIIPAHGIPAGGTWLLEQVLEHRLDREDNILFLHHAGKTQDEMLSVLYPGLEAKLLPLARQNIRQHMRKLGLLN
ncbi:MAG: MBL fold metallo-hydrolase [Gammaproteobacteria bacterium]|nr:MBL fold metallo-hydrolase [Gammaproteobacteria bacterium]